MRHSIKTGRDRAQIAKKGFTLHTNAKNDTKMKKGPEMRFDNKIKNIHKKIEQNISHRKIYVKNIFYIKNKSKNE